jgi:D-beta-D-heptose 7-phosphate kinase / D-beta-D-heptose 1-phosphate adenosyltransferase
VTASARQHVTSLIDALPALDTARLSRWGQALAPVLRGGGRLLAAGNGGSAAQAQHLTAEMVGRFRASRPGLSALALHTDASTVTAVGNDFGFEEIFARQVRAHGRPGDVLLVLSTSGASENVRRAVLAAAEAGLTTWALTGPVPNPVATACDDHVAVRAASATTVQECHLVAVHLICAALDDTLGLGDATVPEGELRRPDGPGLPPPGGAAPSPGPRRVPPRGAGCRSQPAKQPPFVIVGDVLLDTEITGAVTRISPAAPVPVVGALRRAERPGGAGLAALMASRGGLRVTLVTALGTDEAARTVTAQLTGAGVTIINLGTSSPTAVKTRVRSQGQTMMMLDSAVEPGRPGALPDEGRAVISSAAAVLVSDYGRGVAAAADVRAALAMSRARIVWDPHPRGPAPVSGVTVATPSSAEAARFAPGAAGDSMTADVERGRQLLRAWDAGHVLVTRGSDGAVLISDGTSPPLAIPAPMVSAGDSCGAGDHLAVTLTAGLAAGSLPAEAAARSVRAASEFVAGLPRGTWPQPDAQAGNEDAVALAARVRAEGGTVVVTGGCFDLLHHGHVTLLHQARQLGDCLIVCLNSDASAARLKGPPRPLATADDRAAVLEALSSVDSVIVFDEDTPEQVLAMLRPHVYVKGGDYALADLPERAAVEHHGGHVVLVPYLDGRSSTSLVSRAADWAAQH